MLSVRLGRERAPARERTRKNDFTLVHNSLETNPALMVLPISCSSGDDVQATWRYSEIHFPTFG